MRAAQPIAAELELQALVVTLRKHGMLVVPAHGEAALVPAARREVFDVTGAGGYVAISVLAASLAARFSPIVAAAHRECRCGRCRSHRSVLSRSRRTTSAWR